MDKRFCKMGRIKIMTSIIKEFRLRFLINKQIEPRTLFIIRARSNLVAPQHE